MFDATPAVTRAWELAQQWACREACALVAPAHVLQGLLYEQEGRPWLLLKNAGIDPSVIRKPFDSAIIAENWADLQADSAVREILVRAQELARRFGEERTVASEHLLMAVLEMDDALRQTLECQGLRFADLTGAVEPPQGPPIQLEQPLDLSDAPDTMAAARILDANANRAREALRVLEDYCRFILDDAFLSRELKTLRHNLTEALNVLPPELLLLARDTPGDVGTNITTAAEMDRGNVREVLQAGCKRLQESLRGLEEYGKISSPDFARQIEALRYRSYTLERALLLGTDARARLEAAKLCVLVSTDLCRLSLAGTVSEAAAGGAQIIQLREKNVDDRTLLERARLVREVTRKAGVVFILNDRPDLARLAEADGLHLGQDDLPLREARRIVGPDALIGVSTHNLDQLRQAVLDGASYIGIGPTFPSSTKNFPQLAGLDFIREATAETTLPAFAIGGITVENAPAVKSAGARAIAVSSAVCQANDPRAAAAALCKIVIGH